MKPSMDNGVPINNSTHSNQLCIDCISQDLNHSSCQNFDDTPPNFVISNNFESLNCTQNDLRDLCSDILRNRFIMRSNCGIVGCVKNHSTHTCFFCSKQNDHFSINCPETIEVFHATKLCYLDSIAKEGLLVEKSKKNQWENRFGNGIYFTGEKECINIAKNMFADQAIVLRCKVHLKECKDFGFCEDRSGKWVEEFYSVVANHPPWYDGVTQNGFREYVLKNGKYCRVYEIIKLLNEETIKIKMKDYRKCENIKETIKRI